MNLPVILFLALALPISPNNLKLTPCEVPVKYKINMVKAVVDDREKKVDAVVIVDAKNKMINVSVSGDKPKEFKITIDSSSCTLGEKHAGGKAFYKGYFDKPNGKRQEMIMEIKVEKKSVIIIAYEVGRKPDGIMKVESWELVK